MEQKIESLQLYPDDRGFFMELARLGRGLATDDSRGSATDTGILHSYLSGNDQSDPLPRRADRSLGTCVRNGASFLYDLGRNSRTFGEINTIRAGKFRPWEIPIQPGVGHGYKALGVEPVQLLYFTDRHYNPADELRIAYNDPAIADDWETQHK